MSNAPNTNAHHTPGPWVVLPSKPQFVQAFCHESERNEPVATVYHFNGELDANARLVALAPDLLALAKSIARQDHVWFPHNLQLEALINGWIDAARAAVAKAEGGTPS